MSQKNPVEEYLTTKTAGQGAFDPVASWVANQQSGFFKNLGGTLREGLRGRRLGESVGKGLLAAGGAAAGAGVVAGAAAGVQKLYDAATKANDFRQMLELNPHLQAKHQEDPKLVNQMFSTLRRMNPGFTRDPVVAGTYVSRMVDAGEGAGGIAVEALSFSDKMRNPLADRVTGAAFHRAEKPGS